MKLRTIAWTSAAALLVVAGAVAFVRMRAASDAQSRLHSLPVEAAAGAPIETRGLSCSIAAAGDGTGIVTVTGRAVSGGRSYRAVTALVEVLDGAGTKLASGVAVVGEVPAGAEVWFGSTPIELSAAHVARAARVRVELDGLASR
jgi:hypothetical protein